MFWVGDPLFIKIRAQTVIGAQADNGRLKNCQKEDDKNMLGKNGHLFVKCMRQGTKIHLYHLLGVFDYHVM